MTVMTKQVYYCTDGSTAVVTPPLISSLSVAPSSCLAVLQQVDQDSEPADFVLVFSWADAPAAGTPPLLVILPWVSVLHGIVPAQDRTVLYYAALCSPMYVCLQEKLILQ